MLIVRHCTMLMFIMGVFNVAVATVGAPFITVVTNFFKLVLPYVGVRLSGEWINTLVILASWVVVGIATKAGYGDITKDWLELLTVVLGAVLNMALSNKAFRWSVTNRMPAVMSFKRS